ncbi:MAG: hypothetical protein AABY22_20040, partial [Nanoarchaeota archaeon]
SLFGNRQNINNMKTCKTCGQVKGSTEFWANPKTRDKLKTSCIVCCKAYNKHHYKHNREERIAEVREYQRQQMAKILNK